MIQYHLLRFTKSEFLGISLKRYGNRDEKME
jgi:hypothetical protein